MIELFKPNNHSVSEIKYKEVDNKIKKELSEILLEEYSINHINSIAQVQETEINSNNFRVKTENGDFLLRISALDRKERLERVYNISEYCRKNGVPTPEIIQSRGKLIAKNEKIYTLFKFIPGYHFSGSSLEELAELGRGVAKLHKALSLYKGNVLPDPPKAIRPEPPYSSQRFQQIKEIAMKQKDSIEKTVLTESEYLTKTAREVKKTVALAEVRKQPIHLDLHPHNTIFMKEKLEAILDFEICCVGELVRDVAYALHRGVRQYIVKQKPNNIKKAVNEGKKVFLNAYEGINHLTKKEKKLIPLFIQDEGLHRTWLVLSNYYLRRNSDWIGDLEKQIGNIKEAEYFKDD